MPSKSRSCSVPQLKEAGNELFRSGQYGEAAARYTQAIAQLSAGKSNPEELGILYSNRAACYLKDGNCSECIKDCTASLELIPFGIKPLLRRAAAYEALERYHLAYVDYKTALQVDSSVQAAHDGINRMTKALTEKDGLNWRNKLPVIPTVPLSVREKLNEGKVKGDKITLTQQNHSPPCDGKASSTDVIKRALSLKEEGNALVKKGDHKSAVEKYTESLKVNPKEATTLTNRALCYLSLKMYAEAKRDCSEALRLDYNNIKALYRRAQAQKELKDYTACVADLKAILKIDPKNTAVQKLLQEVQKIKK
ncbi:mitochondrial import receptor subunit TOM34 [Polypterus senegalus]|nr:mitochondrial import receptor subunit TOM34 [Polypterus senegalus]